MAKNKIDTRILDRLQHDFFDNNPVKIDINLEGQGIDEDGNFILGCRAAVLLDLCNLAHEMAHLAEREVDKLLERPSLGWGYSSGKYWEVAGQSGFEPQTDKSVLRERNVFAFQASICREYDIPMDEEENTIFGLVQCAKYLPAFCIFERNQLPHLSAGRIRENRALELLAEQVTELADTTFSFANFRRAWDDRMVALKQSKGVQCEIRQR